MKLKVCNLLALLVMLMGTAACGEKAMTTPAATATANSADITLVPYTSRDFDLSGVVPEGWVQFSPGHFQPAMPSTVPTLFGQFGLPGATIEQITELVTLPESVGSRETSSLTWDLYSLALEVPDEATITMEFALAEVSGGLYVIMLGSLAEDHEVLRVALFVPALEALLPTPVTGGDAEKQPQVTILAPLTGGPAPINTRIRSTDGMVMVYVPAGDFQMGHDAVWRWSGSLQDSTLGLQALTDQRPQHTVYLDAFWIDQTEVTVGMFRAFVEATGYVTTAEREGYRHPYKAGPKEQEWPRVPGADWQHPRGVRVRSSGRSPGGAGKLGRCGSLLRLGGRGAAQGGAVGEGLPGYGRTRVPVGRRV